MVVFMTMAEKEEKIIFFVCGDFDGRWEMGGATDKRSHFKPESCGQHIIILSESNKSDFKIHHGTHKKKGGGSKEQELGL